MGFTKSKADSNLYYKVEEGNPVILLLYVDDMFVIGDDGLIVKMKRKLATGYDALLFRHGGVAECGWNIPETREYSRDPEEVRDD